MSFYTKKPTSKQALLDVQNYHKSGKVLERKWKEGTVVIKQGTMNEVHPLQKPVKMNRATRRANGY